MRNRLVSALLSALLAAPGLAAELSKPVLPALPQAALPSPAGAAMAGAAAAAQPPASASSEQASQPTALEQVQTVKANLGAQLQAMEAALGPDPVFDEVRRHGLAALDRVEGHLSAGRIDPAAAVRTHAEHPELAATDRPARIGFYPVAGDPLQWAHVLIGLRAMAEFGLDKVYYVFAGDDPRKPNMTPAAQRHPMGRAVLDAFAPFFDYSPIAVGTDFDGETNLFRTLALNRGRKVEAVYLVGGDHYKLKDAKGNDDTLPKIEKKLASPDAGHDRDLHSVSVAFIRRGGEEAAVPTSLAVHFLDNVSFEASSTLVRQGRFALMPFAAYDWVRRNRPGQYGIAAPRGS